MSSEKDVEVKLAEFTGIMQQTSWALRRFYVEAYEFCAALTPEEQGEIRAVWPHLMVRGLVDYSWNDVVRIFKDVQHIKNQYNINSAERAVMMYMKNKRKK